MTRTIASKLLRRIAAWRGSIVAPLAPGWQRERQIIEETRTKTQLLLTDPAALHLLACVRAARLLPGDLAEAGVYKGGSARLICEQKGERPLHLFDVFEVLQDINTVGGDEVRAHFGSIHGAERAVRQLLAHHTNVHFHTGVFPQTTSGLESLTFSFVHLDLDLDEPTRAALEFFHTRMISGGIMLVDDYSERFLKSCVDDWFTGRSDTLIELPWSQLMVVRQKR